LNRHATAHWRETGHPIIRSFEPDEEWFWDYAANDYTDGPELAPPDCRPRSESAPGPSSRLPEDWRQILAARRSS
jgi:hypothetical protein